MIEFVELTDGEIWRVGDTYRSKKINQIYELGDSNSIVLYDEHTNALVKYPVHVIERIVYYEVNE